MVRMYYILKRGGEIAITTMVSILFILVMASIVASRKGGAAAQSLGAYQSIAVLIVKIFFVIVLGVTAVVAFLYALITRR